MVNILFHIVHILFIYTVNRGKGSWGGGVRQRDQNVHNIYNVQNVFSIFLQYTKGVYDRIRGIPCGSPEIPLRGGGQWGQDVYYIYNILIVLSTVRTGDWLTEWGGGQTERSKCTYHQSRLLHPLRLMGKRGKMFKIWKTSSTLCLHSNDSKF